jgi:hypothetical protein
MVELWASVSESLDLPSKWFVCHRRLSSIRHHYTD